MNYSNNYTIRDKLYGKTWITQCSWQERALPVVERAEDAHSRSPLPMNTKRNFVRPTEIYACCSRELPCSMPPLQYLSGINRTFLIHTVPIIVKSYCDMTRRVGRENLLEIRSWFTAPIVCLFFWNLKSKLSIFFLIALVVCQRGRRWK